MQTPRGEKTKRITEIGITEKKGAIHTFLSKRHLSRRKSVDLRVTHASRASFVSPFSPSPAPRVMVHGLIPITMNLSDVKTQSPPESGLPSSALRPADHKSRGICDRISYTSMQRGCKGGCEERARPKSSAKSSPRWKLEGVKREKGRERRREKKEREREGETVVRLDFSTFDGEETEQEEKPGRLHGAAEKVANSKTFRGPIISDETTVRHQGGCPVYLDL